MFRSFVALASIVSAATLLGVTLGLWQSARLEVEALRDVVGRLTWYVAQEEVVGTQPQDLPQQENAYDALLGAEGVERLVRATGAARLMDEVSYFVKGVDPGFFEVLGLTADQGRLLSAADEVVVGAKLADLLGKTVSLSAALGTRDYRVVGVLPPLAERDPIEAAYDSVVFVGLANYEGILGVSELYLQTTPEAFGAVEADVQAWLEDKPGYTLEPLAERYGLTLRENAARLLGGALGVGVVAVLLAALANLSAFYYSQALSRLPVTGIRRALGATRRQVVLHDLLTTLPQAALGTLLALPFILLLGRRLGPSIGVRVTLQLAPFILLSLAVVVLVALASLAPLLWSVRQPPLGAMRALSARLPQQRLRLAGAGLALGAACLILQAASTKAVATELERLVGNVSNRVGTVASVTTDESAQDPRQLVSVSARDYRAFLASPLADKFARSAWMRLYFLEDILGPAGAVQQTVRLYQGDLPEMVGARLVKGRLPEAGSLELAVGQGLQGALFGTAEPVGQTLTLLGRDWQVVGVFVTGEEGIPGGVSSSDVLAPGRQVRAAPLRASVIAEVEKNYEPAATLQELADFFSARYDPQVAMPFQVLRADSAGINVRETFDRVKPVYSLLAALLLMLGGAGLAAQLLVSVSLRQREIGVRKALGASSGMIFKQLLLEALAYAGAATALGCLLGVVLSAGVSTANDLPFVLPYRWFPLAFAVTLPVALASSLLPSLRAAHSRPAVSLRQRV